MSDIGTDSTYNGWKNYQTWAIDMHISNEQETYLEVCEIVKAGKKAGKSKYGIAADMREYVFDGLMIRQDKIDLKVFVKPFAALLMGDLIGWAIDSADWLEMASHWMEDIE